MHGTCVPWRSFYLTLGPMKIKEVLPQCPLLFGFYLHRSIYFFPNIFPFKTILFNFFNNFSARVWGYYRRSHFTRGATLPQTYGISMP